MAKVQVQIPGGSIQQREADTVGELAEQLSVTSHQASVNGEPADMDQDLEDYQFVSFAPKVKGAVVENPRLISREAYAFMTL
jgi:hypothetical protein